MCLCDRIFLQLAWDDGLNQVSQSQGDLCNFGCGDGGEHGFFLEGREQLTRFVAPDSAIVSANKQLSALIQYQSEV